MIIYECDVCKMKVNNYGHWYDTKSTLYKLTTEVEWEPDDSWFNNFHICQNCIQKIRERMSPFNNIVGGAECTQPKKDS